VKDRGKKKTQTVKTAISGVRGGKRGDPEIDSGPGASLPGKRQASPRKEDRNPLKHARQASKRGKNGVHLNCVAPGSNWFRKKEKTKTKIASLRKGEEMWERKNLEGGKKRWQSKKTTRNGGTKETGTKKSSFVGVGAQGSAVRKKKNVKEPVSKPTHRVTLRGLLFPQKRKR